ncbi:uncharacterized protein RJT21DRAFT_121067 [Scheffersomyces amazonensis]|uniref:uncharacterized protein n=1 Tax=Scheffersomyces amazonensis TaxID=1078765 RepID=UPI00315CA2AE
MKGINRPLVFVVLAVFLVFALSYSAKSSSSKVLKVTSNPTVANSDLLTNSIVNPTSEMSSTSDLKSYIITLKDSVSDADINALHSKVKELGGQITTQYTLIKGFVAKLPPIHISSFEGHDHVATVEEDQEVKIQ